MCMNVRILEICVMLKKIKKAFYPQPIWVLLCRLCSRFLAPLLSQKDTPGDPGPCRLNLQLPSHMMKPLSSVFSASPSNNQTQNLSFDANATAVSLVS